MEITASTIPALYYGTGLSVFALASPRDLRPRQAGLDPYGINLQISRVRERVTQMTPAANDGDHERVLREVAVAVFRGESGIEQADVRIRCCATDGGEVIEVPTRRLPGQEAPIEPPRFGGRVRLETGTYRVEVTVDDRASAAFIVEV